MGAPFRRAHHSTYPQAWGFTPISFSACVRFRIPMVWLFALQSVAPLARSCLAAAALAALAWAVIAWSNWVSRDEQRSLIFWVFSAVFGFAIEVAGVESAKAAVERRTAARPVTTMLVRLSMAL